MTEGCVVSAPVTSVPSIRAMAISSPPFVREVFKTITADTHTAATSDAKRRMTNLAGNLPAEDWRTDDIAVLPQS